VDESQPAIKNIDTATGIISINRFIRFSVDDRRLKDSMHVALIPPSPWNIAKNRQFVSTRRKFARPCNSFLKEITRKSAKRRRDYAFAHR
jgi:hypothetical protein